MNFIFVTGASTGIGFETVKLLLTQQQKVIALVRNSESLHFLKEKFENNLIILEMDMNDLEKLEQLPKVLKEKYQITKLEALVNNAGIASAGPFLNQNFSEILNMLNTNVVSLLKITQVLLPLLGAKPQSDHAGCIINISSVAGKSAAPFLSAYAASKHAVEGFSQGLRKELMIFGIPVVVIGPGSVKTPIWKKGFDNIKNNFKDSIYADSFMKFMKIAHYEEENGLEIIEIAELISTLIEKNNTKKSIAFRYAPIPRKWTNWYLPQIIPERIYNRMTAKVLGLE